MGASRQQVMQRRIVELGISTVDPEGVELDWTLSLIPRCAFHRVGLPQGHIRCCGQRHGCSPANIGDSYGILGSISTIELE